ncbi:MAG: PilX N-terminal domain-containing pilus assembly protein [Gammaproteobacteria bacterium]|nr:PilX N-terminal domain-containing pilus assembly protein [Gammaproteobacteria bacterium]
MDIVTNKQALPSHQAGATLIIGLVLLVALTIIGVASLSTTSLEHRMAGNMGDVNQAFNAAETAGRAAQLVISKINLWHDGVATCAADAKITDSQVCINKKINTPWWSTYSHSDWMDQTIEISGGAAISNVKTPPHVMIENLHFLNDELGMGHKYVNEVGTQYYRVTSRGTGRSDNSQAIVQQTIAKRFN